MGRAPIICKHGIRGVSNCKDCQREQHTERVRELRRQKRELKEQEEAEEKAYRQENPAVVYISSTEQFGKGTAKDVLVIAKDVVEVSVNKSCGNCASIEDCKSSLFYRTYPNVGECPNWRGRR